MLAFIGIYPDLHTSIIQVAPPPVIILKFRIRKLQFFKSESHKTNTVRIFKRLSITIPMTHFKRITKAVDNNKIRKLSPAIIPRFFHNGFSLFI